MTDTTPTPGIYRIEPAASMVEFTTTHLFGLGKVAGKLTIDAGEISVAATPTASTVSLTVPTFSFDTGNSGRDKAVKSKRFLDATRHPVISFSSNALHLDGDNWLLTGDLTVRGVSTSLDVRIDEAACKGSSFTARATGVVDRYDLGVTNAKRMAGRRLEFTVTIHARNDADGAASLDGSSSANRPRNKESAP